MAKKKRTGSKSKGSGKAAGAQRSAAARSSSVERSSGLTAVHAGIILAALAAGLYLSGRLVGIKLALDFDPSYVSSCNYGSKLNCDVVQTSDQSTVLGRPLALWGFITYLGLAIMAGLSAWGPRFRGGLHAALVAISGLAVLHSVYLAYVSTFEIGAYCLFCMGMYGVNLTVFVASALALPGGFRGLGGLAPQLRDSAPALGVAAAILAVTAAVALPAYGGIRKGMMEESIAAADQAMSSAKDTVAQQQADPAPKQRGPAASASSSEVPDQSKAATRKGLAYYLPPVHEEDFAYGPADADVTVVEFADFQCGYCKRLGQNMKPLKKKYEGKVRWVFKHFPLDTACNPKLTSTMHNRACAAAKAANCAGEQGKFWEMHDLLFDNQHQFSDQQLQGWAAQAGVSIPKWQACYDSGPGDDKIDRDVQAAIAGRVYGTPRTFINGHLVAGAAATEILDYYIKTALEDAKKPKQDIRTAELAPVPAGTMVQRSTAAGEFWIDAFENSLSADGKALNQPGVLPAQVSWFEAEEACEKAGKRLCTEEEWVSACTGSPAVDNNGDGRFADDEPEGNLFPYGPFYLGKVCNDDQHKERGKPTATGSMPACRSEDGIFDMSGNMAEWTGTSESEAAVTGSMFTAGAGATCRGRYERFGPGHRTKSTGFRCCADEQVADGGGAGVVYTVDADKGSKAPEFSITDAAGKTVTHEDLEGEVTIISFFASWCGPCRRELPDLNSFYQQHGPKGLKVLAIGVDKDESAARTFAESLNLGYRIAYDPDAVSHGRFGVQAMPTAFLVGPDGTIVRKQIGINSEEMAEFKQAALDLLGS